MAQALLLDVGRMPLLAALLFLCGELYKLLGLKRHLVPAALAPSGVTLAIGFGLADGIPLLAALAHGVLSGIIGAALCVYIHQLSVQARRADRRQVPFKGFYFNKKGEGI